MSSWIDGSDHRRVPQGKPLTAYAVQCVCVMLIGRSAYRLRRVPMGAAARSRDVEWRITDEMWQRITALLPPEPSHARGGRPRQPARLMMEGALYALATGSKWKSLPPRFGAASTVYGHVHRWHEAGVFRLMVERGLLPPEWYAELERRARRMGERRRVKVGGLADQDSETHDHRPTPPVPHDRGADEAAARIDVPRSQI